MTRGIRILDGTISSSSHNSSELEVDSPPRWDPEEWVKTRHNDNRKQRSRNILLKLDLTGRKRPRYSPESESDEPKKLRLNLSSRSKSRNSSELESDEPRRSSEKKARFDSDANGQGKNRLPEIDLSRLIPCGKVHIGGRVPSNGLFTRPELAKQQEMAAMSQQHDASDGVIMQSIETDEIRKHVHFQPMHQWDSAKSTTERDNVRQITDNELSPRQVVRAQNKKLAKRVPTPYYLRETVSAFSKPKVVGNKEAMARMRRKVQMQRRQAREGCPRGISEIHPKRASLRKTVQQGKPMN